MKLAFTAWMTAMLLVTSCAVDSNRLPQAHQTWIEFTDFEYRGTDPAAPRVGPGQYLNPILSGFYPDPSVCRVGDDFFLVNSSFAWFPGVPIYHSRDLVSWNQLGHVLDRPSQLKLDGLDVSQGIFAPTITYHEGLFYVVTTLVGAGGNFYVTAKDPAGPCRNRSGSSRSTASIQRSSSMTMVVRMSFTTARHPMTSRCTPGIAPSGCTSSTAAAANHRQRRNGPFPEADLDRRAAPVQARWTLLPDRRRGRHGP
jgi:hypothetical protein